MHTFSRHLELIIDPYKQSWTVLSIEGTKHPRKNLYILHVQRWTDLEFIDIRPRTKFSHKVIYFYTPMFPVLDVASDVLVFLSHQSVATVSTLAPGDSINIDAIILRERMILKPPSQGQDS